MALFYFFATFMSCLIECSWVYLLLHSLCYDMLFWLKYTENLPSRRHVVGKGRSILITSSENCGNFSLILHQNPPCGRFLEVSCNVESEHFILYYIKTHWGFCSLNDLLPMHNFLTSHFVHLEDIGSLGYTGLPYADILLYIM